MIYLSCDLNHCMTARGEIGYVHPTVRIGLDASDNVDVQKLRDFQTKLQHYIEKGLNDCLVLHATPKEDDR